jgi:PAS domain S-box-containing protein
MVDEVHNELGLGAAFPGSDAGIALNDLAGRFVLVNEAYCRITGYSEKELASRDFRSITHPDDVHKNLEFAKRMFAGEIRRPVYEKRYIRKDGEIVWIKNTVSVVYDSFGNAVNSIAVTEEITASKYAVGEAANGNFRLLAMDLSRSEESEGRRIARELHDSTAQLLAGLTMNLSRLQAGGLNRQQRDGFLVEAVNMARQCTREIRTLSYLLHPPLLQEFGLVTALRTYAEEFSRRSGIEVRVCISPEFGRVASELEFAIFRIVQEGLANVHKHSGSPLALITLERTPSEIRLELLDYGCGLGAGPSPARVGVGLLSMRERAELAGGRFEIISSARGTRIAAVLPLAEANEKDADTDRG